MTTDCKPRVVVSRCLGFEPCRYNGQMLADDLIERLKSHVEIITVCPEADIGLGTPRAPVRLVKQQGEIMMIQPSTGEDVSQAMHAYNQSTLAGLSHIDGFIMKSRSPSCGPAGVKVYASSGKGATAEKGVGLFAQVAMQRFPFAAIEDEGRLKNFHLREAFLMRLFALARLRQLIAEPSVAGLTTFHASHKLLMMCFHQEMMRQCGRIASNGDGLPLAVMVERYAGVFREALNRQPGQRNIINALYHGYGWISEGLSAADKKLFLDAMEEYRDDRVTLATMLHLLKSYVARFAHDYLGSQHILEPYPRDLFHLSDSGR
ncbi:MAG: DUF523 and DUF1722 domain-containing protein [Mariprofundus sp.]|nr:DUF523 and DUF1722 domain-containing protein [Mariprofundus sp.]